MKFLKINNPFTNSPQYILIRNISVIRIENHHSVHVGYEPDKHEERPKLWWQKLFGFPADVKVIKGSQITKKIDVTRIEHKNNQEYYYASETPDQIAKMLEDGQFITVKET